MSVRAIARINMVEWVRSQATEADGTTIAAAGGWRILDAKGLGRPLPISGADSNWAAWRFSFEVYVGLFSKEISKMMEEV